MRLTPLVLLFVASAAACNTAPIPSAPTVVPNNTPSPAPGGSRFNGPTIGSATRLDVGATIRSRVEWGDPACFYNWDATGMCRFFEVTPLRDGELSAVLVWKTPSGRAVELMDLFLVEPNQSWTYADVLMLEKRQLVQDLKAGESYVLIAMAYGQAVDFELTVEM